MTLLLKQLFGFFKLLNSETGTNQLAAGVACGFVLGMTPALSLQTILVFLVVLFFRVQMGAAFLAAFFFKFVAFLLDPTFDWIGRLTLENPALQVPLQTLYNLPIVPLTRFNNSIVMGSAVVTIASFPFIFFFSRILIQKYRVAVVARIKNTPFWKAIQATGLYKWYYQYDQYFG